MANLIPRRDFLGKAALGTAASGLVGSTLSARAADEPSNRVVVGVMGLSRGRSLATQFSRVPGVEVKYVCDIDTERVATAQSAVEKACGKKPEGITEMQRILDDKEVDALVCAAPNHWHAPATILGCKAEKHVYVEKPCSHNPREGELMVEAARKYNRAVQMGSQRRSSSTIIEAIQMLHDGKLGRVYSAQAFYNSRRGATGKCEPKDAPANVNYELWQGPAPRIPYVSNRVHYKWHWFWHYGNGELGNNGVHTLDICRWGLDVDYATRITSNGGRYRYDDDQQTPDTHNVSYECPDKKLITWTGHSCNVMKESFVVFRAEEGSMHVADNGEITIYDNKGEVASTVPGKGRGDREHIENFVAAIRNDTPFELNAQIEKGHKSTLLCHLGNIAHRTGRTLNCDAKSGRIMADEKAMAYWQRDYEPGWEPTV